MRQSPNEQIIVGVDASEDAAHAADWAAAQADLLGVPLRIVHALDVSATSAAVAPIPFEEYLRRRTATGDNLVRHTAGLVSAAHPGLNMTTEVANVGPTQALVELSADAQLVVVGTRGRGGFAGMRLGSVGLKVAAHAQCPAVVVPLKRHAEDIPGTGPVVLGVDYDEPQAPIMFAFEWAARRGAGVQAIHVMRELHMYTPYGVIDYETIAKDAEEAVNRALQIARKRFPEVPVTVSVTSGNAVPELTAAAQGSRLLVIGAHRHRGPLSLGVGYVVRGLLAHSGAPVAVVPIF